MMDSDEDDDGSFIFDLDDGEPVVDARGAPVIPTAFLVVGPMAASADEVTEMEYRYRHGLDGPTAPIEFDEAGFDEGQSR